MMPTNAVSVAATGLPTRRLALATLAGAGAARALLKPVHAATSPDGDVFAQVRETKRLQQAAEVASDRYSALDDKVCALAKPRPQLDKKALTEACVKVLLAFDTVTTEVDQAVLRLRRGTEAAFQAEVQAWGRERKDLEVRTGLKAAKRSEARAVRRMIAAVNCLAAMKARPCPA